MVSIIDRDKFRSPSPEDPQKGLRTPHNFTDFDLPVPDETVDIKGVDLVSEKEIILARTNGRAAVRSFWITMTDGMRYRVGIGQNLDPAVALDVPVVRTNPLGMQHQGASRDRTENNLAAGWPVIYISAKQNAGSLSLDRMTHDQFAMTRWATEFSDEDSNDMLPLDQSLIRIEGESRAAVIGLDMTAQAAEYGYEVLDLNIEAPAAGEQVVTSTLKRDLGHLVLNEAMNQVKLLTNKVERQQMTRNLGMVCRSLTGIAGYVGDVMTLAQGPGGEAATRVPHDTPGRIAYYKDDKMQWEPYHRHFSTEIGGRALYPNMTQAVYPGAHGSLASKAAVERQAAYVQELAVSYRYDDLSVS